MLKSTKQILILKWMLMYSKISPLNFNGSSAGMVAGEQWTAEVYVTATVKWIPGGKLVLLLVPWELF